ncbi:MAG TPA: helix-turn-helix transcriptional regulator [Bryobacteraceae bacterium]|nr:helix-turn-helix transcriptional regulator [Bryobacteraceae bacterium]
MPTPAPFPPSNCAPALALDRSRKLAGISLDDIAGKTKISLRFLKAIEAGEYEKLPGGIFTTSYLRQYAAATGFDEAVLLEHYHQTVNPPTLGVKQAGRDSWTRLDRWFRMPAQASR